jgi:hypothetical protein
MIHAAVIFQVQSGYLEMGEVKYLSGRERKKYFEKKRYDDTSFLD